jgi:hypothetical protein
MENERSLNHGLDIGAAVGVVASWQELTVGLYVMQRHGVSSKAYMGRNVGPLLYLTKLDVKYHHHQMENERSLNHGLGIGAAVGVVVICAKPLSTFPFNSSNRHFSAAGIFADG